MIYLRTGNPGACCLGNSALVYLVKLATNAECLVSKYKSVTKPFAVWLSCLYWGISSLLPSSSLLRLALNTWLKRW